MAVVVFLTPGASPGKTTTGSDVPNPGRKPGEKEREGLALQLGGGWLARSLP